MSKRIKIKIEIRAAGLHKRARNASSAAGAQLTCFTGTKIQILTLRAAVDNAAAQHPPDACGNQLQDAAPRGDSRRASMRVPKRASTAP